jgi:hypothetical protein
VVEERRHKHHVNGIVQIAIDKAQRDGLCRRDIALAQHVSLVGILA